MLVHNTYDSVTGRKARAKEAELTCCIGEAPLDILPKEIHHTGWPRQDLPFDVVDFKRLQSAVGASSVQMLTWCIHLVTLTFIHDFCGYLTHKLAQAKHAWLHEF